MKFKKIAERFSIIFLIFLILSEFVVRMAGLVDFPIYFTNDYLAYMPLPNQSGKFLNKNAWFFNNRSMATFKEWNSNDKPNLLLIGNSIVMGGNHYNQSDKLAPLIQKKLGDSINVWPIAAGGWTNVNEVAYFTHNKDILESNSFFVWECMNGGFSGLSAARGEYVFPTKRPFFASWYFLRRYILPKFMTFNDNELPPIGGTNREYLDLFKSKVIEMSKINGKTHPGILFYYPTKKEYLDFKKGTDYIAERKELEEFSKNYGIIIVDIAENPRWNISYYREKTHPTVDGNKVLSDILSIEIKKALSISSDIKTIK